MKRNQFLIDLASSTGVDSDKLDAIMKAMTIVFTETALEQDSIAIPGFGTFSSVKTDEQICETDGKRMLMPPHIGLTFRPSVILRKTLE